MIQLDIYIYTDEGIASHEGFINPHHIIAVESDGDTGSFVHLAHPVDIGESQTQILAVKQAPTVVAEMVWVQTHRQG